MSISPSPAVLLSLLTAVVGTVLYHLTQKQIPADANPAATLTVVYLIGAALTFLLLLVLFRPTDYIQATRLVLNWNTAALGLAVVLIEIGFLTRHSTVMNALLPPCSSRVVSGKQWIGKPHWNMLPMACKA